MEALKQDILDFVNHDYDDLVSLRRDFHRHPEIGGEEHWTAARIEQELEQLGLPYRRVGGTGVVAWLEGAGKEPPALTEAGKPRSMALRADIDALPLQEQNPSPYQSEIPGFMHACGHDVHTTSLIGAARVLCAFRERFAGRVIFVFQPGEENGYGGKVMVDEEAVDGATSSFGFHIAPELKRGTLALVPGPNNASVDWFRIRIHGTGAHVAYPHQGADALYMAAQVVVAAQALVTRLSDPTDSLLIGFGKLEAGVAYNVVAGEAILEGTIRSLDPERRRSTVAKLEELVQNIAKLYGGSAEIEWDVNAKMLINEADAVRRARRTAVSLFGEEVLAERKPALIGDDMSEFIEAVGGCYAFIGTQNPKRPETALPLHHVCLDVDEEVFKISVPLLAAHTLAYMRGEV